MLVCPLTLSRNLFNVLFLLFLCLLPFFLFFFVFAFLFFFFFLFLFFKCYTGEDSIIITIFPFFALLVSLHDFYLVLSSIRIVKLFLTLCIKPLLASNSCG